MNVYMLEDAESGLFYRRRGSTYNCWVEQKKASIWTSRGGPAAAQVTAYRFKNRNPIIRTFELESINE